MVFPVKVEEVQVVVLLVVEVLILEKDVCPVQLESVLVVVFVFVLRVQIGY